MTPEDRAREAARKLAEYHFPKSRHQRNALENDIYLELKKQIEQAFADGLAMGLGQSGHELFVELDEKDSTELARRMDEARKKPPVLNAEEMEELRDATADAFDIHPTVEAVELPMPAAVPSPARPAEEPKHLEANGRREPVKRVSDPRGYIPR